MRCVKKNVVRKEVLLEGFLHGAGVLVVLAAGGTGAAVNVVVELGPRMVTLLRCLKEAELRAAPAGVPLVPEGPVPWNTAVPDKRAPHWAAGYDCNCHLCYPSHWRRRRPVCGAERLH